MFASSALSSYSRLRAAYDDDERRRYSNSNHLQAKSPWSFRTPITTTNAKRNSGTDTMSNNTTNNTAPSRRTRYSRSTTTSVTQMLSDSCSSLLQKLTTKVRGPSATGERIHNNTTLSTPTNNTLSTPTKVTTRAKTTNIGSPNLNSTRSRLFDEKYAAVLDRIYGRKRDPERTLEPSVGRTLAKSATSANVILSEKAYPYVSSNVPREKTPYRTENKISQYRIQYPELPHTCLDRDTTYRVRHKSNHSELRPRRPSKPQRTGKSEVAERRATTNLNLKLCPVEIPLVDDRPAAKAPPPTQLFLSPSASNIAATATPTTTDSATTNHAVDDDATPTPSLPDAVSEREAKRKEIQSLIMKYSALDEAYNRTGGGLQSTPSATATIAQKYQSRLTSVVSKGRV